MSWRDISLTWLCYQTHVGATILSGMPREGAIIFRELVGKLNVLNIECEKCGRRGRYHLDRLIERYGLDAKLFEWSDEITADCPRKQAMNLTDICGARCPDPSKVVCRNGVLVRDWRKFGDFAAPAQ
jgi:hypothetical protein